MVKRVGDVALVSAEKSDRRRTVSDQERTIKLSGELAEWWFRKLNGGELKRSWKVKNF